MTKFATFASDVRVSTLLCCSAAVLLAACGGAADAAVTAGQQNQTAAESHDSAANQAGVFVAALPPDTATTPAATETPAATDAASVEQAPAVSETEVAAAALADSATRQLASTDTVAAASASIYNLYVATTGSDSNPGTQARPFKTIQRGAAMAKPSTTIHVAAGTYRGNVTTKVHGTATARIRYVSDTKWGAKIIGSGTEGMWTNNSNYTDIVGFDITGSGRIGILNMGSYTLFQGNNVHNLTVSGGCNGGGGAGIVNANYSGSDGDIIGNVVHDIGVPGKCNGVQGIYSSNLRGRIFNNIVYRASAFGIHLWHAANYVTIANNTVFANGAGGMGGGIVIGVGDSPGGKILTNTKVINNIVYKNPAVGIMQYCYSGQSCIGSGNVVANNLVSGNGSAIRMKVGSATGTITADPQFVNYQANGTGDYRLKSTSPAVNKGTASSAPTTDINNIARPRGAAYDIGAYENY
jgi:parallel beta-helix repeat protein